MKQNKHFNKYPSLLALAGINPNHLEKGEKVIIPQGIYISEGIHPNYMLIDKDYKFKTPEEKAELKKIIGQHKSDIRATGKNPKKHMNPTSL